MKLVALNGGGHGIAWGGRLTDVVDQTVHGGGCHDGAALHGGANRLDDGARALVLQDIARAARPQDLEHRVIRVEGGHRQKRRGMRRGV